MHYHAEMPLWPTLCCVNLWLVVLFVPICLADGKQALGTVSPLVLATAALAPLCFFLGVRYKTSRVGQAALLIGVPLLVLLPTLDGPLADPRLHPRSAVILSLLLLLGYLATMCRSLALTPAPPPKAALPAGAEPAPPAWQVTALAPREEAPRLHRRIALHRLLLAYTVLMPAVLLYAIDFHPAHLGSLRASFGSAQRVAAMQATLTALLVLLYSVVFYFGIMAPLASYLDHHRELRSDLQALRRHARLGRPRLRLYLFMGTALLGMVCLILLHLRQ